MEARQLEGREQAPSGPLPETEEILRNIVSFVKENGTAVITIGADGDKARSIAELIGIGGPLLFNTDLDVSILDHRSKDGTHKLIIVPLGSKRRDGTRLNVI